MLKTEDTRADIEAANLEQRIGLFFYKVGQGKLTVLNRKTRAEELLHELREDSQGPRVLRETQSKDYRDRLRGILATAEQYLAQKDQKR